MTILLINSRKKLQARLILIFHLLISASASANFNPVFQTFNTSDGLPSSEIYSVIQDLDGYMWFATDEGVSRYNGFEFQNFTEADGLTGNVVLKMDIDRFGRLWFICYNGTLCYFENELIIPYKFNDVIQHHSKGIFLLKSIFIDENSDLYVGSVTSQSFKIDSSGNLEYIPSCDSYNHLVYNLDVNNGTLFNVAESKLMTNPAGIAIIKDKRVIHQLNFNSNYSVLHTMCLNKNDMYFLNVENQLFIFHDNMIDSMRFETNLIHLYLDPQGNLWISTLGSGVHKVNVEQLTIEQTYFENRTISSTYQDVNGSYWFTTTDNGIYYVINPKIEIIKKGDLQTEISCLALTDSILYVGDVKGKLVAYDLMQKNTLFEYQHYYRLTSILKTIEGSVIISSDKFYSIKSDQFIPIGPDNIGGSFHLRHGYKDNIIINTASEIYSTSDFKSFTNFDNLRSFDNVSDSFNNIYLADDSGVLKLSKKTTERLYSGARINSLAFFKSYIIGASLGKGLIIITKQKNYKLDSQNGLISDYLNNVHVENDSSIWVSSNSGISNILISKNAKLTIRSYTKTNGLVSNEVKEVLTNNDKIILRYKNSISVIPKNTLDKNFSRSIGIKRILVNGDNYSIEEDIVLDYNENTMIIELEMLCVNCLAERNLEYSLNQKSYRTSDNFINLTSIEPGDYELEIRLMDNKFTNVYCSTQLHFTVLKPVWNNTFIRVIFLILLIFITFRIVKFFYTRKIKLENQKTNLFNAQQKALLLQMKPHFIFNSLNSVQRLILKNEKITAHRHISQLSSLIRKNLELADSELIALNEELELLELYFRLEQKRIAKEIKFSIEIEKNIDTQHVLIPPFLLQPLVENALWHGINFEKIKQGKITIHILCENNFLIIKIIDNGVGYNHKNEKRKNHNSLSNSILTKRLKLLEAKYNFDSKFTIKSGTKEGGGTIIKFKLPIIND